MTNDALDIISERGETALMALWKTYSATKQGHNYLPLYHRHFDHIRMDVKRVLEIGVQTDRSVKMWSEYFPRAEIWGLDIDPNCKKFETDRIKIAIGDQSDPNVLRTLPSDFDIIIDDGSHEPRHQIGSFMHLFQHNLKARGIYVVEDCETRHETIQFFAQLIGMINLWPEGMHGSDWPKLNSLAQYSNDYYLLNTIGISFYRYIIFIDKGRNPEDGEAAHRLKQV